MRRETAAQRNIRCRRERVQAGTAANGPFSAGELGQADYLFIVPPETLPTSSAMCVCNGPSAP